MSKFKVGDKVIVSGSEFGVFEATVTATKEDSYGGLYFAEGSGRWGWVREEYLSRAELPSWIEQVGNVYYVKTAREALAALDYIPEDAEVVVADKAEHRKLMLLLKGMGLR